MFVHPDGLLIPNINIVIKRHPKSRCLKMRVDLVKRIVVVTAPNRCHQKIIDQFIVKSNAWLACQQHKLIVRPLPAFLIISGQQVSIRYKLLNNTNCDNKIEINDNEIIINGPPDQHKNYLLKYLKALAHQQANTHVTNYAQQLSVNTSNIGVKEYKSRWGCCYKRGDIYLSWRLIMAPVEIFKYVCAHEVAHLIYQNHSQQFWQLVSRIYQDYQPARRWLRDHGSELFSVI